MINPPQPGESGLLARVASGNLPQLTGNKYQSSLTQISAHFFHNKMQPAEPQIDSENSRGDGFADLWHQMHDI